jgi:hypothetical protein
MRQLLRCAAGLALLMGCADPGGLPTNQGTGNQAQDPSFDGAEIERGSVGLIIIEPGKPLLVMTGFAAGVTLADLCAELGSGSPNSISQVVLPPAGGFLAHGHGQDVPVLVYTFEGDPCDGVGESLLAAGTGRFHMSDERVLNGAVIQNTGVRGTLDLVAGGQALLAVKGAFYQRPDGSVKFDKTSITLTPL